MSTETRVLTPEPTNGDDPEVRFRIDEEAYNTSDVALTLSRGTDAEEFRVTDADEAVYEGSGVVPAWCEASIHRLGLYVAPQ